MLSSHMDVVDAGDPAGREHDPFGGEVLLSHVLLALAELDRAQPRAPVLGRARITPTVVETARGDFVSPLPPAGVSLAVPV
jgi:hypothetical protein